MTDSIRKSQTTGCLFLLIVCILSAITNSSYSQNIPAADKLEYSAGFGMMIYQSGYGMNSSFGIEAHAGKFIKGPVKWQAGLRSGVNPVLPEAFCRLLLTEKFGRWKPSVGFENGISKRAYFDKNSNLLKEAREATTRNTGVFYVSSHSELLAFQINPKLVVSILEIDFGTHYRNFGRTLRLQTTLLRLNMSF